MQAFKDPHDSVRESLLRVRASPFLLDTTKVRGFVFDVKSGLLEEVTVDLPVHDVDHAGSDDIALAAPPTTPGAQESR